MYRDHQRADSQAQMRETARRAQARAFEEFETLLSAGVQGMSLADRTSNAAAPQAPRANDRYRMDQVRKIVAMISGINDEAALLLSKVESLQLPPSASVGLVRQVIDDLKNLRECGVDLQNRLNTMSGHSKEPAVVEMRSSTQQTLDKAFESVSAIKSACEVALQKHGAEANARLESGVSQYDSGESP